MYHKILVALDTTPSDQELLPHIAQLATLVKADVAQRISAALGIPTIGIGSGPACDGQVLVTHDLIGLFPWFTPKFARQHTQVAAAIDRKSVV